MQSANINYNCHCFINAPHLGNACILQESCKTVRR